MSDLRTAQSPVRVDGRALDGTLAAPLPPELADKLPAGFRPAVSIAGDMSGNGRFGRTWVAADTGRVLAVSELGPTVDLQLAELKDFRIEDLRLVIGQGDGLPFLVPMALWHLERDPLAEGDFYPGDLLKNVAGVDDAFWAPRPEMRARLVRVLEQALVRLPGVDVPGRLPAELRSYLQHHRPA